VFELNALPSIIQSKESGEKFRPIESAEVVPIEGSMNNKTIIMGPK
jgi:hypothetical protein